MDGNFAIKCIKDFPPLAYKGEIVWFKRGVAKWMNGSESLTYKDIEEFFRCNKTIEKYFVEFKEIDESQVKNKATRAMGETICSKIKPSYYNSSKITPFDYIKANDLDFFEGNVIKYITRYKKKNGMEDLLKAKTYLEEIIKGYEKENEL